MEHRIVVEFENIADRNGAAASMKRSSYFDGKNSTGAAFMILETYCESCKDWYHSAFTRCPTCPEKKKVTR